MTLFSIDPDAVLDYAFDWRQWLAEDEVITAHEVIPTDGVTVDSSDEAAGVVTVWVSGATGPRQAITCRITTDQGRTDDRTIKLNVRDR